MKINCDIGERGSHADDLQLMSLIDIANIACGGHAGDARTVSLFREMADQNNVSISAHLSYPDRENFGRKSLNIPADTLKESLSEQYCLMEDIKTVKFHGALYNDCWINDELSLVVTEWLLENGINQILMPGKSSLAKHCGQRGIKILREAFAERRYQFDSASQKIALLNRSHPMATICEVPLAVDQYKNFKNGFVRALNTDKGQTVKIEIGADTVCIHSDSEIALELAKALKNV